MNLKTRLVSSAVSLLALPGFSQDKLSDNKQAVIHSVETHQDKLIELSDKIWAFAETAMLEHNSARVLSDYAESQGFKVERGVAEIPTAFIATYGSGKPIIGIMGEFDALPGLSQKAQTKKEPLEIGSAGHGCGIICLDRGAWARP